MKTLFRLLNNKVSLNACWLIGGNVVYKLLAFIVGLWTARYLGPENYGLINYSLAYTVFFFSLCTLGINSIIVKELIDKPHDEGTTMGTTLVLQCCSSLISVVIILTVVYIIDSSEPITIFVTFLCSLGLVFQMLDSLRYWFQAKLLSKYCAIATTLAYIITSIYRIILLINQANVYWFALATSVDYICVACILWWAYKRQNGPKLSFNKKKAKSLLSKGYHYILAGLMVSIYAATDRVMLKQMVGDMEVGYYGTAMTLCNVWVFILTAIIDSFNPVIMENKRNNTIGYAKKNMILYSVVFYSSSFVSLFFVLFANNIIHLLYGEAYLPSASILTIATWYVAFSYLGIARNAWIVCENKQKYLTPLYVSAAILNVLLNLVLIPRYHAIGAALSSLITQFGIVFVFPLFIKSMRANVRMMVNAILFRFDN